jgi:hypothetical protein
MDIEPELPEDFDQLPDEEKIEELEDLKERFEAEDESPVKIRMIEELISSYEE